MSNCAQKRVVLARFTPVAKAMANEHRVRLLVDIACGEHSVKALAERSGLSMAQALRHLQLLKLTGLISKQRHGQSAVYELADNRVLTILDAVYKTVERDFEETELLLLSYLRRRKSVYVSR